MRADQKDRAFPTVSRASGFRTRHWIATFLLLSGGAYLAYPYYCLYRIDQAMQSGSRSDLALYLDADTFEDSVRQEFGAVVMRRLLAAIMAEAAPGTPPGAAMADVISGMLADFSDGSVLADLLGNDSQTGRRGGGIDVHANDVRYAFFETPTVFRVDLGAPGSPREDWVTVRLRLAEWVWKLSELHLPT